ncbi:MAG TPA: tetratricopeptide repeat protein, partial [Blastocatellia bacterium]|nr:tetratricopeptide repeat protein [Blastocatellia bacterium]
MARKRKKQQPKPQASSPRFPSWARWAASLAGIVALAAALLFWRGGAQDAAQPSAETRAVIEQVQALHRDGKYDEAIELVKAHLARDAGAPLLHYSLGVLMLAKNDPRAAIPEFEEEIRRNPSLASAHKQLGIAYTHLGEVDEALPFLEKALEIQPEDRDASFQLGLALNKAGRSAEAEKHLLAAAQSNNPNVYSELGIVYRRLGQDSRAAEYFRKALANDPRNRVAVLNLGQLLIRMGQKEEGEQLLSRHTELSRWYDQMDRYQKASRLSGATPGNFIELARIHLQQENYSEAASAFRRALELDARNLEASLGLADIYLRNGQLDESERWITHMRRVDPDSSDALFLLGLIHIARGRVAEAEQALDSSRRFGPWDGEKHRRLGMQYLRAKQPDRAISTLVQSVSIDDRNPDSYFWLGIA